MQAIGLIETKGLIAAIESADAMLKAADVNLLEKTNVGGGLVTIIVTGDVAAVKAAVDSGAAAVNIIGETFLISKHVIPRPHEEIKAIVNPISLLSQNETLMPDKETEETDEEVEKPYDETEKAEEKPPIQGTLTNKEAVDKAVLELGIEDTIINLNRLKVIELRNLAREYKDFGITGRRISKADKKLLLEEFRKYYKKID